MEDIKPVVPPFTWMWGNALEVTFTYNQTKTLLENVYALYKKVQEITKSQNELINVIKAFIEWTKETIKDTTINQLQEWLEDGTLAEIINDALLKNKVDKVYTYADDFATLAAAVASASLNSKILVLSPKEYDLNENITSTPISIKGDGSIIKKTADVTLKLQHNLQARIVQSHAQDDLTISGQASRAYKIVVDVTDIKKGDVLFIQNNSLTKYEFAVVFEVGSNYVITNYLRNSYTDMVISVSSEDNIVIDGITFIGDHDEVEWNKGMLELVNIHNVSLDIQMKNLNAVGLELVNCFNYTVTTKMTSGKNTFAGGSN